MAITFPLSAAPELVLRYARFMPRASQGVADSPFSFQSEVQDFGGAAWLIEVELPQIEVEDAEAIIGWGLSLNGAVGSFLMPPPRNQGVRGNWGGSPQVNGAHAAGATSILMDGFTPSTATVKAGDWFQVGTGSTTHLHKVTQDETADGSGELTLEIWPPLRATLANNTTLTTSAPNGLWRLAKPVDWDISPGGIYTVNVGPLLEKL